MSMITLSGPIQTTDGLRPESSTGSSTGTSTGTSTGAAVILQPGDHLAAKVLRIGTDQRALMDFGRFRALAQVDHSVRPGQTLLLKVMDGGFPVHMQILADQTVADRPLMPHINLAQVLVPEEQRDLARLVDRMLNSKVLVSAPQDHQHLRQALVGLQEFNTPLSLDLSIKEITAWLQNALEDRSLFFEKKLAQWLLTSLKDPSATPSPESAATTADTGAQTGPLVRKPGGPGPWPQLLETRDLKAQLMFLKSFLNELDAADAKRYALKAKETTFLQKAIERLLGHLEQQQEHLIQRSPQSHIFQVVTHWLPVKDRSQPLKLKLYYPKKERSQGGETPHYICLLLDMDRLGPIRADLRLSGEQLQLTFSVLTPGVRQAFEAALTSLMPGLEALFGGVSALVQVSQEKITRFDEEQMMALEPGRIDIQA